MTITWQDAFEMRDTWKAQVAENSARIAFAYGVATTTGQGSLPYEDEIEFGLAFTEQPMVSYGAVVTNRTDFEQDDPNDDARIVPLTSGVVYDWVQDGRGLYVGAFVAVYVLCDDTIEIEHHFTFQGMAIKDVGGGEKLTL